MKNLTKFLKWKTFKKLKINNNLINTDVNTIGFKIWDIVQQYKFQSSK